VTYTILKDLTRGGIGAGLLSFVPDIANAAEDSHLLDFTGHWAAFLALGIFFAAYVLVIGEEALHMRKSKPVMVAAGIIWLIVAILYNNAGASEIAEEAVRHNLLEFAELFLFLLAAMTYINTMDERGLFNALRGWLVSRSFSFRTIFWVTGVISFFLSPIADNLTTALLMATVILAVARDNHKFVVIACINIVVAANAGGAFSPFGDITTLMVWQKGLLDVSEFILLFPASVVNWLVPAVIMSFAVMPGKPEPVDEHPVIQEGAWVIVGLFLITIAMAVSAHNFLGMPPVLGMMTGLGFLKLFGYYLKIRSIAQIAAGDGSHETGLELTREENLSTAEAVKPFNVFKALERAEWDTLMFFYGIILCVGGLGTLGFLAVVSEAVYVGLGPTTANILVGIASAIVDNIPVMFAVLAMMPEMSDGQWLLVTLTAGVGGSMLSIGSAAGVAVMGQARGIYTFVAHLKWTWAIGLGYAASIWVHFLVNGSRF
jgi:Na+/H+ antiporter NhaD/arsenite permease-like protein